MSEKSHMCHRHIGKVSDHLCMFLCFATYFLYCWYQTWIAAQNVIAIVDQISEVCDSTGMCFPTSDAIAKRLGSEL